MPNVFLTILINFKHQNDFDEITRLFSVNDGFTLFSARFPEDWWNQSTPSHHLFVYPCIKNMALSCGIRSVFTHEAGLYILYEGVSNSFRNHPKVKEPEISFLHFIHRTSLKSHYAKLHFCLTFYWLFTARNYTVGHKSVILRFINIFHFSLSALNDRYV